VVGAVTLATAVSSYPTFGAAPPVSESVPTMLSTPEATRTVASPFTELFATDVALTLNSPVAAVGTVNNPVLAGKVTCWFLPVESVTDHVTVCAGLPVPLTTAENCCVTAAVRVPESATTVGVTETLVTTGPINAVAVITTEPPTVCPVSDPMFKAML
jgi:hypothetical protein